MSGVEALSPTIVLRVSGSAPDNRRPRGTSNGNSRGSSRQRAARRAWLLLRFGDGWIAPCYRCGTMLDDGTLTVDRITPGCEGGSYFDKANIRPACGPCNSETGGALGAARRRTVDKTPVRGVKSSS